VWRSFVAAHSGRCTEDLLTALILLIRHAAHAQLGNVLSGRIPGIGLSSEGRTQAERIASRLDGLAIDAVHSSPLQRAQETAFAIIAHRPELSVETVPELQELDFGDWAGQSLAELAEDPQWDRWNTVRANARPPGGESMAQAQQRAWTHVEHAAEAFPGGAVVMVTHCDIIRAVVAKVLGMSLNLFHRMEVDPATISRLVVGHWGAKVLSLNETCP